MIMIIICISSSITTTTTTKQNTYHDIEPEGARRDGARAGEDERRPRLGARDGRERRPGDQ